MSDTLASLFNDGMMILNRQADGSPGKTIIVTGVARSGTSMVAHALSTAGVFMGEKLDDVVFEDAEIAEALITGNTEALAQVVALRDCKDETWGFKRPHLFNHAGPELETAFRNPHFILTYRDPVAIAKRNRISEHFEEKSALRAAVADLHRCVEFALDLTCPVLLISYEKALQQPEVLVEQLISFCGLTVGTSLRERMEANIEANPAAYLQTSRRQFEGHVDVVKDGFVGGWCRQIGDDSPVLLEVCVGGGTKIQVMADGFRSDLADAGFGTGCHGFSLDISGAAPFGDEIVAVRVHDRLFELTGSGQTVNQLSR